jgi:hypothetical protein
MTRETTTCRNCCVWPALEGGNYCEACEQKAMERIQIATSTPRRGPLIGLCGCGAVLSAVTGDCVRGCHCPEAKP